MVKKPPANDETQVRPLGGNDSMEKGMATHCSTLAWRESHGQRSLVGYSPWGCTESDTTQWLTLRLEGKCGGKNRGPWAQDTGRNHAWKGERRFLGTWGEGVPTAKQAQRLGPQGLATAAGRVRSTGCGAWRDRGAESGRGSVRVRLVSLFLFLNLQHRGAAHPPRWVSHKPQRSGRVLGGQSRDVAAETRARGGGSHGGRWCFIAHSSCLPSRRRMTLPARYNQAGPCDSPVKARRVTCHVHYRTVKVYVHTLLLPSSKELAMSTWWRLHQPDPRVKLTRERRQGCYMGCARPLVAVRAVVCYRSIA